MNPTDYQKGTRRTELTDQQYAEAETRLTTNNEALEKQLSTVFTMAMQLEYSKKLYFHGKDKKPQRVTIRSAAMEEMVMQRDVDKLHHAVGIIGEAAEVLEATLCSPSTVLEEVGDLLFYVARLLDSHGLTLEQAMQHNHDKLMERYPPDAG